MSINQVQDYWKGLLDLPLFTVGDMAVTLFSLLYAVVIMAITVFISRLAQRAVGRLLGARALKKEGTLLALKRLVHYIILLIGLAMALQTVGVKMQALFAAGAIFAVAVGFAMQNIVQNFVSGVILLIERTIQPGDVLEVEGKRVKISEMGIRATVARTRDGEDLLIPNTLLVQSLIKNLTMKDPLHRLTAKVGVAYESDLRQAFAALRKAADSAPWRAAEPEPNVLLTDFGDSSVNFAVQVWTDNPWDADPRLSDLNDRIWWALKEAGIAIAFPQVDVHLDKPVVEGLQGVRRAG